MNIYICKRGPRNWEGALIIAAENIPEASKIFEADESNNGKEMHSIHQIEHALWNGLKARILYDDGLRYDHFPSSLVRLDVHTYILRNLLKEVESGKFSVQGIDIETPVRTVEGYSGIVHTFHTGAFIFTLRGYRNPPRRRVKK